MSRLIDADELAPMVKRLIEMAPTVDAVKHGRWMDGTCSECGKKPCDDCQQFDCYGCEYAERKTDE